MFLISSRECFGIERSGRSKIGMKEETEVWLILVLFFAIRECFRDHNPVSIRGAVWDNRYRDHDQIYGSEKNGG